MIRRELGQFRVSVLADQFDSAAGGGRFTRGLVHALAAKLEGGHELTELKVVATQGEELLRLERERCGLVVVRRRFPVRLRQTRLAGLAGATLPRAEVAHGPFYYMWPCRAQARTITLHDLSFLDGRFHPPGKADAWRRLLTFVLPQMDGVVCDSDAVLHELHRECPGLGAKAVRIYPGVGSDLAVVRRPTTERRRLLAVGTLEPRKNYTVLLDAYDRLRSLCGEQAPLLVVVGARGWMNEDVERRLGRLVEEGWCEWRSTADDAQLSLEYSRASLFSYISLYEGFGYPPFEAALAGCPIVVSSESTVGEIWRGHAPCVNPRDPVEIASAWRRTLSLEPGELQESLARQRRRTGEFSWERAAGEYLAFWRQLVSESGPRRRQQRRRDGLPGECKNRERAPKVPVKPTADR